MEFFRIRRDIPFMRHALVFNIISFVTFLAAVFFLATRGLHLSIEFTGGTVIEVAYAQPADIGKVRGAVEALGFGEVQVQNFGTSRDVLIRLPLRGDVKQADLVAARLRRAVQGRGRQLSRSAGRRRPRPIRPSRSAARPAKPGGAEPVRLSRSEFVGPQVGKELADRRREGARLRGHRHHDLPGVPLRVEVLGRRRSSPTCTT